MDDAEPVLTNSSAEGSPIDGRGCVYDYINRHYVGTIRQHIWEGVVIDPTDRFFAYYNYSTSNVVIVDLPSCTESTRLTPNPSGHEESFISHTLTADGRLLYHQSYNILTVWVVGSWRKLAPTELHFGLEQLVRCVVPPVGDYFLVQTGLPIDLLINKSDMTVAHEIEPARRNLAVFSPDGTRLARIVNNRLRVCHTRTNRLLYTGEVGQYYQSLEFSPDNSYLVYLAEIADRLFIVDMIEGIQPVTRSVRLHRPCTGFFINRQSKLAYLQLDNATRTTIDLTTGLHQIQIPEICTSMLPLGNNYGPQDEDRMIRKSARVTVIDSTTKTILFTVPNPPECVNMVPCYGWAPGICRSGSGRYFMLYDSGLKAIYVYGRTDAPIINILILVISARRRAKRAGEQLGPAHKRLMSGIFRDMTLL